MRALLTREQRRIKSLVAHGVSIAVIEAEVRTVAVKGSSSSSQCGRECHDVREHIIIGLGLSNGVFRENRRLIMSEIDTKGLE